MLIDFHGGVKKERGKKRQRGMSRHQKNFKSFGGGVKLGRGKRITKGGLFAWKKKKQHECPRGGANLGESTVLERENEQLSHAERHPFYSDQKQGGGKGGGKKKTKKTSVMMRGGGAKKVCGTSGNEKLKVIFGCYPRMKRSVGR